MVSSVNNLLVQSNLARRERERERFWRWKLGREGSRKRNIIRSFSLLVFCSLENDELPHQWPEFLVEMKQVAWALKLSLDP